MSKLILVYLSGQEPAGIGERELSATGNHNYLYCDRKNSKVWPISLNSVMYTHDDNNNYVSIQKC